uniref:Putative glycoside hydrolase n=1 Tax=viral metagenome TaxID=1070528 RepID=A0A6M3K6F3_9ZZZZ
MADFVKAHNLVMIHEGGYQANEADSGNYACGQLVGTKYGISAPTLQTWTGRCPSPDEMKNLSKETARLIYKERFWDKLGLDYVENQSVAEIIYDCYVNQTGYTLGILRMALEKQGFFIYPVIPFDHDTIISINNADQKQLFDDIKEGRRQKYLYQASKPSQSVFLEGWLKRLNKFEFGFFQKSKYYLFSVVLVVTLGIGILMYLNKKELVV